MVNSKLLELIKSFSPEEKDAFILFLNSPYFVRVGAAEMIRYFNYMVNLSSVNQEAQHYKEALHQAVYPEKPWSEARLERASTRLYQLAIQFLKTQYYLLPDNELHQELEMAVVFRKRNMVALYIKQMMALKKKAAEIKQESTKNYLFKYQIAYEEHVWQSLTNNLKTDLAIADLLDNLDLFYHNERTEMLNRFSLHQKMGNPKTSETLKLALDADLAPSFLDQRSPLLLIRKKIRESFFLSEPDRENFENLTTLLKTHEHSLAADVTGDLYSFLRSYCTYLISTGQVDLQVTLHEIQKDNLKKGYFHFKGKINPINFSNITRVALGINQVQWAKEFVESNRKKILTESELEEVYKLNLALCLFEEKKFEQALSNILYSFHSNVLFWVARRLELRIHFELQSDLLPYRIESFRKYIQRTGRKNASGLDMEANANFIHVLLQLAQSAAKNAKRSESIIRRIYKKKLIAERKWLLEKAYELA